MDEQRIFELKQLCNKKWRMENPKGYFGQKRHESTKAAAEWMCKLAGFKSLEEADAYFKHQNSAEQESMIKEARVLQKGQPAWTAEQQSYVRSQLYLGLEGAEVAKEPAGAKVLGTSLLLVLGLFFVALYAILGRRR